jgi:hypothetical protein
VFVSTLLPERDADPGFQNRATAKDWIVPANDAIPDYAKELECALA